ncbi:ATP-citrate synthase beta chain protein 2 [Artemisia annua]|uniref:ATP citrate synthase n=1 Tax=Artemisia annua TaxID=35608 RepID=A0A2U1L788_ARTAN|nr:ATP-citrate synthase beta chain protein 2 [Artemisia annua]
MATGQLFSRTTQALFYNYKQLPIQRMLDFDFLCGRETPSVAGIINPGAEGFQKLFFGQEEIAIPVHSTIEAACAAHPTADVFINFASYRSAAASSNLALKQPTIRVVAIIAEGVPESDTKELIAYARSNNKVVIGPATVGGIQAGAFKIGDTAGTIDNIIQCKLYRPGSVGFVSKSGGMSNELYNTIARVTDGIYEGIAIGGDVFPGSTLSDHVLRFNNIPQIKMIVVLGELGGRDEYSLVEALKAGKISKPVCAWVSGTCARLFKSEVQFGHAGAKSGGEMESAQAKNQALMDAGAVVPTSYEAFETSIKETFAKLADEGKISPVKEITPPQIPEDLNTAIKSGKGAKSGGEMESAQAKNQALMDAGAVVPTSYEAFEASIKETFAKLADEGKISPVKEITPPQIPEDLNTAIKSGKVRAPTHIISTISDDRGEEPCYAGVPMSSIVEKGMGVGDVISLLWFKRSLPRYCTQFIEICIMLCADHGPCVSGAHNTIVTARAGKDLVSSLVSGLLTIGPRFGGAVDDAARYFKDAYDRKLTPYEFVESMKKKGIRVPGIGHRIKRGDNRDKRVELLQLFARTNFPSTKYMEYAVEVETYTLSKANNLVMNVDGAIGTLFMDLLAGSGMFTKQEIDEIVSIGYLNGLFVLARSIGLIGHTFDQKRLKQPLYRHPWEDEWRANEDFITYIGQKCADLEANIQRRALLIQESESFGPFHNVAPDAVECMGETQQRDQDMLAALIGILDLAREGRTEKERHVGLMDLKGAFSFGGGGKVSCLMNCIGVPGTAVYL